MSLAVTQEQEFFAAVETLKRILATGLVKSGLFELKDVEQLIITRQQASPCYAVTDGDGLFLGWLPHIAIPIKVIDPLQDLTKRLEKAEKLANEAERKLVQVSKEFEVTQREVILLRKGIQELNATHSR